MKGKIIVDKSLACYEGETCDEILDNEIDTKKLRAEYEEILKDFQKICIIMLLDKRVDLETKEYISNNSVVQKLNRDNECYYRLSKKYQNRELKFEYGMLYDSFYQ